MAGTYNYCLVLLSVLVAIFVSHTALRLSARVASATGSTAQMWLAGGAVAMGSGIWSMHFIGMLAFSLPIALAYDMTPTLASLLAIAISAFALKLANQSPDAAGCLSSGAVLMGAGISAMHYVGMAAIQITPMIQYEPRLLAGSVAIAIVASFAALWLFSHLGTETPGGPAQPGSGPRSSWASPSAGCTTPAWPLRASAPAPSASSRRGRQRMTAAGWPSPSPPSRSDCWPSRPSCSCTTRTWNRTSATITSSWRKPTPDWSTRPRMMR